jgi:luciferase family oxidoreductase group 1
MKLSILDQSLISYNQTAHEALQESMNLAKMGEELGYIRYWIAEHHAIPGLACPAPEIMLSYIGAQTKTIRIGSGAVLLPHYRPYKVAEVFNMLATLFPGRIDMGIGRAPGGSAEATNALSENFLQQVRKMPELVEELLHFVGNGFPADHEYAKLSAYPIPPIAPLPWLLGTSKKSALLAAEKGVPYAYGQFMSGNGGEEIIQQYRDHFQSRKHEQKPHVLLTVSTICAETNKKAQEIALSSLIWSLKKTNGVGDRVVPSIEEVMKYPLNEKEQKMIENMKQKIIIGDPNEVKAQLIEIQRQYKVDEMMLLTNTYTPKDRKDSYQLIADVFDLANRNDDTTTESFPID